MLFPLLTELDWPSEWEPPSELEVDLFPPTLTPKAPAPRFMPEDCPSFQLVPSDRDVPSEALEFLPALADIDEEEPEDQFELALPPTFWLSLWDWFTLLPSDRPVLSPTDEFLPCPKL